MTTETELKRLVKKSIRNGNILDKKTILLVFLLIFEGYILKSLSPVFLQSYTIIKNKTF